MTERTDPSRRRLLFGSPATGAGASAPLSVAIGDACFALHGIACLSCRDACAPGAIRFALARGGARPMLDPETCTGCGACLPVCPAGAIVLPSSAEAAHG